jgi:hypothetical protein
VNSRPQLAICSLLHATLVLRKTRYSVTTANRSTLSCSRRLDEHIRDLCVKVVNARDIELDAAIAQLNSTELHLRDMGTTSGTTSIRYGMTTDDLEKSWPISHIATRACWMHGFRTVSIPPSGSPSVWDRKRRSTNLFLFVARCTVPASSMFAKALLVLRSVDSGRDSEKVVWV